MCGTCAIGKSVISQPVRGVARTLEQAEAENRALREELQRVKNQRDILKKTLGIISAPPETGLPA